MDNEVLVSANDNQHDITTPESSSTSSTASTTTSTSTNAGAEADSTAIPPIASTEVADSQEVKENQKGGEATGKENTDSQTEGPPFKTQTGRKAWKKSGKKKKQATDGESKDKQQWPTPIEASESPKKSHPPAATAKSRQKKGVNWVPLKDALSQGGEEGQGQGQGQGASEVSGSQAPPSNLRPPAHAPPPRGGPPSDRGQPFRGRSSFRGRGRGNYSRPPNQRYTTLPKAPAPPEKPLEGEALKEGILKQFEYYFSTDNLCHDIFLRRNMDEEGWVPIELFAKFPRVQSLSKDKDVLLAALKDSPSLQLKDHSIRKKENWKNWLFPPPSSTTTEPPKKENLAQKQEDTLDSNRVKEGSETVAEKKDEELIEFDESLLSSLNVDFEEEEVKDLDDQHISNLIIITQNPEPQKKTLAPSPKDIAPDVLSIINDGLLIYEQNLHKNKTPPALAPSSGTTPTSTTPTNSPAAGGLNVSEKSAPKTSPKKSGHGKGGKGVPPSPQRLYPKDKHAHANQQPPVGWVMDPSASAAAPLLPSPDDPNKVPYFPHPSHALLQENGFIQHQYDKYHDQCLKERKQKGIGKSQEMNTLFRFWSHFLRTHYNETMYQEMKKFALEDAEANYRYGMECLFRYFSYGLERRFRQDIFNDFQEFSMRDYINGQLYGLEKFWAYLKYRKEKDSLTIKPELAKALDNYKSLKDFRPQA